MSSHTAITAAYAQVDLHAQIEGANAHELIDLLLKGAQTKMAKVQGHINQNNIPEKGQEISKIIAIFAELQQSLTTDNGNEITDNLTSLYNYISEQLFAVNINNDLEKLDEVIMLVKHLRDTWNMIPHEQRY